MDASLSSWLVILLAVVSANLPFVNEKLFALIPLATGIKSFWWRLLELITLYFLIGFFARFLEGQIGTVFRQGWEFYAVTGCLFVVLAFPGFAFRYLKKQHRSE
ncbi:MAG: DUF2818 family protein [Pseudomonadota bacterium]